jgi:lipopolysaccharide transport system ATP-binding protein
MAHSVISVEHLSKRYILDRARSRKEGLRHLVENSVRRPFEWLRKRSSQKEIREEFWALRDVSFDVKQGDVLGVIGPNGAGKSTLLKLISRITEPTSGRIRLKGRVASLLEVGTGFHQELTGRENIYLNGAILGMSRCEIQRKFDEIVAFSEVEKFLDTPVKRYSSGMYVRLAFAVAAHLEPEILIVDEVLAVGDAQFQRKCLGKMGQAARGGRTVLFVSHSMSAVRTLCDTAILLQSGRVKAFGAVGPIAEQYLADANTTPHRQASQGLSLGPALKLLSFEFAPHHIETGSPLSWSLELAATERVRLRELAVLINSLNNMRVALLDLRALGFPVELAPDHKWRIEGEITSIPLVEGQYTVGLTINTSEFFENILDVAHFTVVARPTDSGYAPYDPIYRGTVELTCVMTSRTLAHSAPQRTPHRLTDEAIETASLQNCLQSE